MLTQLIQSQAQRQVESLHVWGTTGIQLGGVGCPSVLTGLMQPAYNTEIR